MGRAYRDQDMDETDDISMEAVAEEIASGDVSDNFFRREDAAEARTVTSRCRIRDQINSDIDAYLANGGAIHPADEYMKPASSPGNTHAHH